MSNTPLNPHHVLVAISGGIDSSVTAPMLYTERLSLRPVGPEDHAEVHRGLSNPAVTRYMLNHYPTMAAAQKQMDWYAQHPAAGTGQAWAICPQGQEHSGTTLGVTILYDVTQTHRRGELGIWLMPEATGQGYAHEACRAVLDYALSPTGLGLNKVMAVTAVPNTASLHLMRRLGFTEECVLRGHEWKDGQPLDWVYFGMWAQGRHPKARC